MEHRPAEHLYKLLVKLFVMQKKRTNGIAEVFNRIKKPPPQVDRIVVLENKRKVSENRVARRFYRTRP
jgi:hypothetical protein